MILQYIENGLLRFHTFSMTNSRTVRNILAKPLSNTEQNSYPVSFPSGVDVLASYTYSTIYIRISLFVHMYFGLEDGHGIRVREVLSTASTFRTQIPIFESIWEMIFFGPIWTEVSVFVRLNDSLNTSTVDFLSSHCWHAILCCNGTLSVRITRSSRSYTHKTTVNAFSETFKRIKTSIIAYRRHGRTRKIICLLSRLIFVQIDCQWIGSIAWTS